MISGPEFDAYLPLLENWEGKIAWMYLDSGGVVTVGCGHALFTPESAVVIGLTAEDWREVKSHEPGYSAKWYEDITTSRLTDDQIAALKLAGLTEAWDGIVALWPACMALPDQARVVVLDMSFNLGPAKFYADYLKPTCHFGPACDRGDWVAAAGESKRNGIQQSRNDWAAETLRSLSGNAVT